MVNCYYNLNTIIPDGNYTFTSVIVPSPLYPSGVSYSGTATVTSIANYCKPYKVQQKNILTTGNLSGTSVTSTETFISKCDKYSSISPALYLFNGNYKICKKGFAYFKAKYKGFSQNYNTKVKGKSIYNLTSNGFTQTVYYKINCGYNLYQTFIFTKV